MKTIIYGLLLLAHVSCSSALQLSNTKPNIIFILADDMSYYDLSRLGQKEFTIPNIKLKREKAQETGQMQGSVKANSIYPVLN